MDHVRVTLNIFHADVLNKVYLALGKVMGIKQATKWMYGLYRPSKVYDYFLLVTSI